MADNNYSLLAEHLAQPRQNIVHWKMIFKQ